MTDPRETLNQFKTCIAGIWLKDGQNTWPIDINSIAHLFMDIFVQELFEDIQLLKTRGVDDRGIAARFKTAARIIRLIMPSVFGMKASRLSLETIRERVHYLLILVKHLKYGDIFNRDGKNIVLSPEEFRQTVESSKMIRAGRTASLAIHKLCAVLWNYAESVCFKTHGLIRQFHGPYRSPHREQEIVIRDFIHLNPLDLWEECRTVPYKKIRVAAAYRDLGITIDIYDNLALREGCTYLSSLDSYYVEADGNPLDLAEINRVAAALSEVTIALTSRVEALDWKSLARKYAEIFWYGKKACKLEQDWQPPREVNQRIENGEISTRLQNIDPQALQRMLHIAF
jgi:hypothetical protein